MSRIQNIRHEIKKHEALDNKEEAYNLMKKFIESDLVLDMEYAHVNSEDMDYER